MAAASSRLRSVKVDSSVARIAVSEEESIRFLCGTSTVALRSCSQASSSPVLVRLPLWASARPPCAVDRKVGCALCQTEAPVSSSGCGRPPGAR